MRNFLARIIGIFATILTLPLSPMRRKDAQIKAAQQLSVEVKRVTDLGEIDFEVTTRWSLRQAWGVIDSEPDTLAWIKAMPEKSIFWDIGANIGTFSLYAALIDEVHVIAFEPSARTYAELNGNIERNSKSDRVVAYCIALAGRTRLDALNMASTDAGLAFHGFGTEIDQFDQKINTRFRQGAIGFTVDDFVLHFSPPLPTHVKIDVDGIEADILRGARRTFSDPGVRSIIVEVERDLNSARNLEIFSLMEGMGFAASPKASPGYRNVVFEKGAPQATRLGSG